MPPAGTGNAIGRPRLLTDILPDFAAELATALHDAGHPDLEAQVNQLAICSLCECDDHFCASFYTGPRQDGPWTGEHRNINPRTKKGMIVLDIVDGRIRHVEVLYRQDVRSAIAMLG